MSRKNLAVLVGNNAGDLPGVDKDLEILEKVLKSELNFEVRVKKNQTEKDFKAIVRDLKTEKNLNCLWFFFSGHGNTEKKDIDGSVRDKDNCRVMITYDHKKVTYNTV